jgi:eukaryotic-like serine/threonine-protein kinase
MTVETIFSAARQLPPGATRDAFVEESCSEDAALRSQVEALLQIAERMDTNEPFDTVASVMKSLTQSRPSEGYSTQSPTSEPDLIGRKIGHYEITSKLGQGGMGVVYKARDIHLDRLVALKILPDEKITSPDRKRRFIQEAKAASALNHPNIVHLYDVDEQDGINFMAMEYVTGKTLGELIPQGGMGLDEALKYALQVADALTAAHKAGIVHRDLKPANVMVDADGRLRVLDFGLAKLLLTAGDVDTTETVAAGDSPMTVEGTILGTASYMSPEQAEGRQVDARSDIFTFGAVLYEMLNGCRAFRGDSMMSTLAAIIRAEPEELSEDVPLKLRRLVEQYLHKDPDRRCQHMSDVRQVLEDLKADSESGSRATKRMVLPARSSRSLLWPAAGFAVAVLAAVLWFIRDTTPSPEPVHVAAPLTTFVGTERHPTFSPDGNQVAFSWGGEREDNFDIYVTLIGTPTPLRLTKDPADDTGPAWSPDGRWIAFVRSRLGDSSEEVVVVPAIGGPERVLAEVPIAHPNGFATSPYLDWTPASDHLFVGLNGNDGEPAGLFLLSVETGELRRLTAGPSGATDSQPSLAPDGRTLAFARRRGDARYDLYLLPLAEDFEASGEPKRLPGSLGATTGSAWAPGGKDLVVASGATFDVSSLLRIPASGGKARRVLSAGSGVQEAPAVSAAAKRLVFSQLSSDTNIWRIPLPDGRPERFVSSTLLEHNPRYSPDGKWIAFESTRSGIASVWVASADGSGARILVSEPGTHAGSPRWSPDSSRIAFDWKRGQGWDVYVTKLQGGSPQQVTTDPADDVSASWSHDGRWIYFGSRRTGEFEVWKTEASGGDAVQITRNGGHVALESTDQSTLYYTKTNENRTSLWKVSVDGGEESEVLASVWLRNFLVVSGGIYFIPVPAEEMGYTLQFFDIASGRASQVAALAAEPDIGLTVSPDGHYFVVAERDQSGADLMLVENFR